MPPPEDRDDADREQDAGERKQYVAQAHDDAVPPAFAIAGDQPQRRAEQGADRHRHEARGQRNARTHEDAAEDVAAERIDAEQVLERRPGVERVVVEEILGVVGDDERRDDGSATEQRHEYPGDNRDMLPLELAPELGPRRAHVGGFGDRRRYGRHR